MIKKSSGNLRIPYPLLGTSRLKVTQVLKEAGLLVFPTETVYGLGGNALSPIAVEKVYRLKQRSSEKALPVLVDQAWLEYLAPSRNERIENIMKAFWPGPLTLIIPALEIPFFLKGPKETLALRWSDSKAVQELIKLGGCPLIGTSANISGRPECLSVAEVESQFEDQTPLVVDGGILKLNPPSSVLDCSGEQFRLLRTGKLTSAELKPFL